jgi:hypothetical protein
LENDVTDILKTDFDIEALLGEDPAAPDPEWPTPGSAVAVVAPSQSAVIHLTHTPPSADCGPTKVAARSSSDPVTIIRLAVEPRWVAWTSEETNGRTTKVPYSPSTGLRAKVDDPVTWGSFDMAADRAVKMPRADGPQGVGLILGDLDGDIAIGGIDLDTCINVDGVIAPWAQEVIDRFQTYTEVSPSGTGVKLFFTYMIAERADMQAAMETPWSKIYKLSGGEHPPAIELYLGGRYFTLTADHLVSMPEELQRVSRDELLWLINEAGPRFAGHGATLALGLPADQALPASISSALGEHISTYFDNNPRLARYWGGDFGGLNDSSRSGKAMALGSVLKQAGLEYEVMCQALREHPATASWVTEKGVTSGERQLHRIWSAAKCLTPRPTTTGMPSPDVLKRTMLACPELRLSDISMFWETWLTSTAEGANAAPDYTLLPLLMLVSALLGNARHVKAWSGWTETAVLWGASVGVSGSGKTPGASPVMDDLVREVEARMARRCATAADTVFSNLAGNAATTPCVRVGNITIEQLANLLNDNPKGLICYNDELAQWFFNFERYGGSDRPFWLQSYSGKAYRVDRVKHPKPINIPHLSVAIFGSVQPDRLETILKGADDGLVGRFLWSWPEKRIFRLPEKSADIEAAANRLFRIADLKMGANARGEATPVVIPISEASQKLFHAFVNRLSIWEDAAHGLLKSAIGKARGQTLRLAMVLHYLAWSATDLPEPSEINETVVTTAIRLMETYFLPMAERVFGDASVPREESRARTLARWIADKKPTKINVTDIRDSARLADLRATKDVKAACEFLEEAHWLIPAPLNGQRGRPRGDYTVHPRLWDMLDQLPA